MVRLFSKKKAEPLFGKINQLPIDSEDDKSELLKHSILTFENMRVKDNLEALENFEGSDLEKFIGIFATLMTLKRVCTMVLSYSN